jgi:carboxymethylenebutenolidase
LYERRSLADPHEAELLLGSIDEASVLTALGNLTQERRDAPGVGGHIAAIGFSVGGWFALRLAEQGSVDAAMGYYASLGPGAEIRCPVLVQLAEVDEWDPPNTPERFAASLRSGELRRSL